MLNINQYFDGNVASIGLQTDSLPATIGVMDVGEYEFSTQKHEVMTVVNGKLSVLLPKSDQWQDFSNGESFSIASDANFKLKVAVQTAYFCTYQDK